MKLISLIIIAPCLGLISCTPAEVEMAEVVIHEAEVAEEAIEADMLKPVKPAYSPQVKPVPVKYVQANQRQYPSRKERNPQRIPNHGC